MSKRAIPYTVKCQHSVTASALPPHLRHFLLTLATLANSSTGTAHYGQDMIGEAMGRSGRQVRSYFEELSQRDDSPVKVERRPRWKSDGSGRDSDEWRLVLLVETRLKRKPASGLKPVSSGSPLPIEGTSGEVFQPEVGSSLTGSGRSFNRKPTSADRRRIDGVIDGEDPPRQNSVGSKGLVLTPPEGTKRTAKAKPKSKTKTRKTDVDPAARKQVTDQYFASFAERHGRQPIFAGSEASAVTRLLTKLKANADEATRRIRIAYGSHWREGNVTILDIARNPDAFATESTRKTNGGVHRPQRGGLSSELEARARGE